MNAFNLPVVERLSTWFCWMKLSRFIDTVNEIEVWK